MRHLFTQYKQIKKKIATLDLQIEDLRTIAESCTVDPTKEKVQASSTGDRFGTVVAKIADLDNTKEEYEAQLNNIYVKIIDRMGRLNETHYIIIRDRYLKGMTWQEIADEIHYSEKHVYKMHNDALKIMA